MEDDKEDQDYVEEEPELQEKTVEMWKAEIKKELQQVRIFYKTGRSLKIPFDCLGNIERNHDFLILFLE